MTTRATFANPEHQHPVGFVEGDFLVYYQIPVAGTGIP